MACPSHMPPGLHLDPTHRVWMEMHWFMMSTELTHESATNISTQELCHNITYVCMYS